MSNAAEKLVREDRERKALMAEAQRLFELVAERLGEYTGEWWTVAIEDGESVVVRR